MITGELIRAARLIQQGGIVAYATEYCFGFGCDPMNRAAVLRLLRIKRRSPAKGLILIAADTDQLAPYIEHIPAPIAATWPGPNTWLLPKREGTPRWITGDHARIGRSSHPGSRDTCTSLCVAVRVTAHAQAAALCKAAGMAIVSTSANRAGGAPARCYREAVRRFKGTVDYVLPGLVGDAPAPTPIRDAITGEIVRPG